MRLRFVEPLSERSRPNRSLWTTCPETRNSTPRFFTDPMFSKRLVAVPADGKMMRWMSASSVRFV